MRDEYIAEIRLEGFHDDYYLRSILDGDYPVITKEIDCAKIFMHCERIKVMAVLKRTLNPIQIKILEMDGGCYIMERRKDNV